METPSLAMSAPLGKIFSSAKQKKECNVGGEVQDVVINRLSLSVGDISFMRLRGCRVAAPVHSAHKYHLKQCCDFSCSTNHTIPLNPGALQGGSEAASATHLRSGQEIASAVDEFDGHVSEPLLVSGKGDVDVLVSDSKINTATGGSPEEGSALSHPVLVSRGSSSQQIECNESFETSVSPLRRKSTVTPLVSPRGNKNSLMRNLGTGVQPFSTWRFPVLGKVDSVSAAASQHEGGVNACVRNLRKETGLKEADISDDVHAAVDVITSAGNAVDVERDAECENNGESSSMLEKQENQRYMKRLRFVYAMYESILSMDDCNATPMQEPLKNIAVHGIQRKLVRFSSLSSTSTATASGYYSLGSRRSMPHANKQVIPVVLPPLDNLNHRQHDDHLRSCTTFMDPTIVSLIERRPLIQTTLFLEFVTKKITRRQKPQQSRRLTIEDGSTLKRDGHKADCTLCTTESVCIADTVANERSSASRLRRSIVKKGEEAGGEITGSFPGPIKSIEDSPATVYRRVLTVVNSWKDKVHSVDGISRCVDNESDDLVVHVGMILMGWLEVVDLLGAGTFGQVFLCKDLRISSRCFVHPSEIEGEDFQYWQCSHEYIPFGDPSMVPKHAPLVAVKVVKSRALFEQQSVLEAEMLVYVGAQTASQQGRSSLLPSEGFGATFSISEPPVSDPRCAYVAKIFAHGVCYGHHCIVMERYGANLFEYVRSCGFKGLPMYQIREIGRKILMALTLLHEECHVVHCDIKPENVLLTLDSCFSTSTIHGTGASASGGITGAVTGNFSGGMKIALENSTVLLGKSTRISCNNSTDVPSPIPLRVHPVTTAEKFPNIITTATHERDIATGSERRAEGVLQDLVRTVIPPLKIRLIDFSSSFYEGRCMHTYMQSRYYRAPEVILGANCGLPIDIWSTGCLLAELLLGLPLLPGTDDHHQLYLIEEMLGPLPASLLGTGRQTLEYYDVEDGEPGSLSQVSSSSAYAHKTKQNSLFRLLSKEEYLAHNVHVPQMEWKCYFQYRTLAELVRRCMLSAEERQIALGKSPISSADDPSTEDAAAAGGGQQKPNKAILDEMMQQRFWLYDLLKKMLHGDPSQRLTAREALSHTFFVQTPQYMKPYMSVPE